MEKQKRKTHTSTAVKQRYNEKVYSTISFSAPKELAAEFRKRCLEKGTSMASILKQAMREYLEKQ